MMIIRGCDFPSYLVLGNGDFGLRIVCWVPIKGRRLTFEGMQIRIHSSHNANYDFEL